MDDITLSSTTGVIVALLLVQSLKAVGMPPRFAGAASVFVGLLVAYLILSIQIWPWLRPWVQAGVTGLVIGAAASGTYSWTKPTKDEQVQAVQDAREVEAAAVQPIPEPDTPSGARLRVKMGPPIVQSTGAAPLVEHPLVEQ